MLAFCAEKGIGATVVERPMEEVNACLHELETAKHAKRFVLTNPLPVDVTTPSADPPPSARSLRPWR